MGGSLPLLKGTSLCNGFLWLQAYLLLDAVTGCAASLVFFSCYITWKIIVKQCESHFRSDAMRWGVWTQGSPLYVCETIVLVSLSVLHTPDMLWCELPSIWPGFLELIAPNILSIVFILNPCVHVSDRSATCPLSHDVLAPHNQLHSQVLNLSEGHGRIIATAFLLNALFRWDVRMTRAFTASF